MFKKILLTIVLLVVLAVGAFVGVVAMQPSEFRVIRSTTIAAPQSVVFEQVNDFHHWQAWSPWAKMDPNAKATFEGPEAGVGAKFAWSGNKDVGEGWMKILESNPNDRIKIQLYFIKPMEGSNDVVFTFKPEADKTVITWDMSGYNNFVGRAFCLVMNMDKMVGDEFEKGLASIKAIAEQKKLVVKEKKAESK